MNSWLVAVSGELHTIRWSVSRRARWGHLLALLPDFCKEVHVAAHSWSVGVMWGTTTFTHSANLCNLHHFLRHSNCITNSMPLRLSPLSTCSLLPLFFLSITCVIQDRMQDIYSWRSDRNFFATSLFFNVVGYLTEPLPTGHITSDHHCYVSRQCWSTVEI